MILTPLPLQGRGWGLGFSAVFHTTEKCYITHDPLTIRISEAVKLQIDLAAETTIAAERDSEKIAVEIKSFVGDSDISAFIRLWGNILMIAKHLKNKNQTD